MFSSEITLTYKHGIILFLIIFMYWYAMDSVKSKTFKTDLEKVINKNISDQNYEYFTEKTHTIIGILCTGIGVVMNGLPTLITHPKEWLLTAVVGSAGAFAKSYLYAPLNATISNATISNS